MTCKPSSVYLGTRVQLFLIGAAKSGTSTLAQWLNGHPDVLLSTPKEPFFFELFYENGLRDYWDACFADRWVGQSVVVDARHRNQYLPFVPGRIAESAPNPLFVSILREPVQRARSHARDGHFMIPWDWELRPAGAAGALSAQRAALDG